MDSHLETDHFSVQRMYDLFSKCKLEEEQISLDNYAHAFEELAKLFPLFGTLFGFVSSDVHEKIGILRDYRKSDEADNYKTIQSMIQYEVANGLTDNKKKASGSRTLLRLHRAMEFTAQMMLDIKDSDQHEKMSTITSRSYDNTLAKHHPWLIRKAVHIAVYTLPKRQHFLEKMKLHDEEEAKEYLGKAVNIQHELFAIIENVYEKDNLLNLP